MSNPYQLIVFDWEGTIADTLGKILHIIATEASNLGFGDVDIYKARNFVALGLVQSLRKLFPYLTNKEYEQLLQAVQYAIVSKPTEVCLIPGAREFIQRLHTLQIDIAVATNKGHHSLIRAMQAAELEEIIKVTRSAGQVPAKPCPQMLEEIMEEFGAKPESTLMIGDSVADMEMAKSINVDAIGVDFYHQQGDALKSAGAIAVFDDYELLAKFLKI